MHDSYRAERRRPAACSHWIATVVIVSAFRLDRQIESGYFLFCFNTVLCCCVALVYVSISLRILSLTNFVKACLFGGVWQSRSCLPIPRPPLRQLLLSTVTATAISTCAGKEASLFSMPIVAGLGLYIHCYITYIFSIHMFWNTLLY